MAVAKKKTVGKKLKSAAKKVARTVKKAVVKPVARMMGANGRKKTTKSKSTAKRTRK